MNQHATAAESRYMGFVKSLQCVICKRFPDLATGLPTEVHHLGTGSSRQNNWLVAPLCGDRSDGGHHRGGAGLHGLGVKRFVSLYKVPQGTEYGLLAWLAEDMEQALGIRATSTGITNRGRKEIGAASLHPEKRRREEAEMDVCRVRRGARGKEDPENAVVADRPIHS